MYEYRCEVVKVIDGDTVDVNIDLGFGVWLKNQRVRLMSIDTPESRTSDNIEKIFGLESKRRLKELLGTRAILMSQKDDRGKFGRILGDFRLGMDTVCKRMIEESYAVSYYGQNKQDIQEAHLKNRQILIDKGIVEL